jgi:hypothetical protein
MLLPASCLFLVSLIIRPRRWRRHVPPKHQLTFKGPQGVKTNTRKKDAWLIRLHLKADICNFCNNPSGISSYARFRVWQLFARYQRKALSTSIFQAVETHFSIRVPQTWINLHNRVTRVVKNSCTKPNFHLNWDLYISGVQSAGWVDIRFTIGTSCERAAALAEKNAAARHHVLRSLIRLHNEHHVVSRQPWLKRHKRSPKPSNLNLLWHSWLPEKTFL